MTIECSQSVHSIDIRPVYYGVQMVICGGKSRFHSVSTWFLGILLCKVKGIGFSNRIRYLAGSFTKTRNRIVKRTGRDPVLSTPCRIRQTALPALSHQFHPFIQGTPWGTFVSHNVLLTSWDVTDLPTWIVIRLLNFLSPALIGLPPVFRRR